MVDICMLVTSDLDRDPRVQKEAVSASAAGFSVKVLCREATVDIPRCEIKPLRLGRAESRLAKYVERGRLNVELAREAIRARPRLLHANDLDTLPAALWAARRLGVPCLFDAHEYYSQAPRDFGRAGSMLLRRLERTLVRRADFAVTVSHSLADAMARDLGIRRPEVVMNGARYVDCRGAKPLEWRNRLADRRVVLFQGRYVARRQLEDAIDAAAHFPRDTVLAMRGYGPLERELRDRAAPLGDRVVFLEPVPMFEMVKAAVGADIGVFTCGTNLRNHLYAAPNKLFEYAMAGVPSISTDTPEVRGILANHDIGRTYEGGKPESLARGVAALLSNPAGLESLRECCFASARSLSWEGEAEKLVNAYRRLIGHPAGAAP